MSFTTALIVDDSKLARIALKKKLELRGLQIVMAEDARQALGVLENTPVDIIFMDHLMPEMDGFQATREIKANSATAHLPVIMCSGKEKQGYLEEARAIGASNVLPKPAESAAIDAVFAELEQLAGAAPTVTAANEPLAATPPVTARVTAPTAVVDETLVQRIVQPLVEQVEALAAQVSVLNASVDDRFATVADTVQALEDRQPAPEPTDIEQLAHQWSAQMDQRFAALDIPDAEAMRSDMAQSLEAQLRSELDAVGDQRLAAAMATLRADIERQLQELQPAADPASGPSAEPWQSEAEQRISDTLSAACKRMIEDNSRQLQSSVEQQLESLRELAAAPVDQAMQPQLDVDGIRQSLKAELIDELSQSAREFAPPMSAPAPLPGVRLQQEVKMLRWLALTSSLVAAVAIVMHWF